MLMSSPGMWVLQQVMKWGSLLHSRPDISCISGNNSSRDHRFQASVRGRSEIFTALSSAPVGTAETEAILRRFTRNNIQHPTYKALTELGKAIKTIFLCRYLHDEGLRREINDGLNVIEHWNSAGAVPRGGADRTRQSVKFPLDRTFDNGPGPMRSGPPREAAPLPSPARGRHSQPPSGP
jgi:hypothetical protein